MTGRDPADTWPDALRFALVPPEHRVMRLLRILGRIVRHPRRTAAIAWARVAGKRLRARQGWISLVGVDHRLQGDTAARQDPEPASVPAAYGIDLVEDTGELPLGVRPFVVLIAPGHALVAGAAETIAAAFTTNLTLHALYGDALVCLPWRKNPLPLLRPAFDPDYLRATDYIGPVVAVRRASLAELGDNLVTGAAAFDLILRTADRFGSPSVGHVPTVLSLWQPTGGGEGTPSRAGRVESVRRSLARAGQGGAALTLGPDGVIDVAYPLPEPRPLVSLIVPTRDRLDLLRPCIASLVACTDWPATEILICDNDSRESETLAYFRALAAEGIARVVPCPGPFNFAAMNNRAAEHARGDLIAFVNNDVEAFRPDWLERMVRQALRPDVGAVGAKLLDGGGRIQHGGIVLGTGGLVTHGHRHFPRNAPGYLSALSAIHVVSAVTAACLVVETRKFRALGGFDEQAFAVDFNDVDLCLRFDRAGWRTMLVPGAVLHHRESSSRRWTAVARARHEAEVVRLKQRWGSLLAQDPHYHPGFDADLSTHARLRADWTGLASVRSALDAPTVPAVDRPPAPSRSRT